MLAVRETKKLLQLVYRKMQENYVSFRLLVWLEEVGIVEWLMVTFSPVGKKKTDLENYKSSSQTFFKQNKKLVCEVISLLEDEKSKEIYKACIAKRCYGKRINRKLVDEKNQYFDEDIVVLKNGERFLDCGAFIGDTIQQLKDRMRKKRISDYKVIAFEPSHRNASLIQKYFGKDDRILLIKKGVSNRSNTIYFSEQGSRSKSVNDPLQATGMIEVISLDDVPECQDATFIKMDIEGAEEEAINGARRIIKANRPKLAICIYHSNEDMVRLPLLIKEFVPEYKLYVRQHSMGTAETVLYAVC